MWIKDRDGRLVNSERIDLIYPSVYEDDEGWAVLAYHNDDEPISYALFEGTEEECKEYMDKLMRDLNGELSYEEEYERQLDKERALAQHDAFGGVWGRNPKKGAGMLGDPE